MLMACIAINTPHTGPCQSGGGEIKAALLYVYAAVTNERGESSAIGYWIGSAIMMVIGGYILSQFVETMPKVNSSNPFAAMLDNLYTIITSSYGLLGIVLIVSAAGIIMWNIRRGGFF